MFYDFPLSIPANTPESSPAEQEINLTYGVITHVEVEFPPNCAGLARGRVLQHRHQLWPTNIDGWFRTDGDVIKWEDCYEMFEPPFDLVIQGYNEDDTFPHEPIFRFEILPVEKAEPWKVEPPLLTKIARFLGVRR